MKANSMKRREFLAAAGAAATVSILPRHVLAASAQTPPSEKLNLAGIGLGSQGAGDLNNVAGGNNVVALCNVDWGYNNVKRAFNDHSKAEKFRDFRKMFDKLEKQIDAVVVATPDHNHAIAAIAAMKRGKHVFCEKPLAHSVHECREMARAAKEHNVVTQLGNQGHSYESCRVLVEWIRDGAIGNVHTIHCGCDSVNSGIDRLGDLKKTWKTPETLDWDLWQGAAQPRPYCPAYLPYSWRGWVPYGNGTIGDWICHVVDPVFWALDLGAPQSVVSETPGYNVKTQGDAYPKGEKLTFEFPSRNGRGPVTLHWYSGTIHIPRPGELEPGRNVVGTGAVVLGDKGAIMYGSHGADGVRIIPEAKMRDYKLPAKTIPRVRDHYRDWVDSVRAGRKAGSDFSYGAPLTEIAMLGVIASRFAGTKLTWDSEGMKFANRAEATALLKPAFRPGWDL